MAKAVLFLNGEMIRQRGMSAPKRATLGHWVRRLQKTFATDLLGAGIAPSNVIVKSLIDDREIRVSLQGGEAYYVDRTADALATNQ